MLKEGDTVKCVDTGFVKHLTKGKEYRVMCKSSTDTVEVVNDEGYREDYSDFRFVKVNATEKVMFEVGDVVRFVEDRKRETSGLTLGQTYIVERCTNSTVEVVNDAGRLSLYLSKRFVLVESSKPGPKAVIEVLF